MPNYRKLVALISNNVLMTVERKYLIWTERVTLICCQFLFLRCQQVWTLARFLHWHCKSLLWQRVMWRHLQSWPPSFGRKTMKSAWWLGHTKRETIFRFLPSARRKSSMKCYETGAFSHLESATFLISLTRLFLSRNFFIPKTSVQSLPN
jgi:hypothetical protein